MIWGLLGQGIGDLDLGLTIYRYQQRGENDPQKGRDNRGFHLGVIRKDVDTKLFCGVMGLTSLSKTSLSIELLVINRNYYNRMVSAFFGFGTRDILCPVCIF